MNNLAASEKKLDDLILRYEKINDRRPIILMNADTMRYMNIPIYKINGAQYMYYKTYKIFIDSEKCFGDVELR